MLRGTTPTLRLRFRGFDPQELDLNRTYVTITQNGVYIEKTGAELSADSSRLYVHLTQADTLTLDENEKATVQMRGVTVSGAAVGTRRRTINVYGIDKEGEI